MNINMKVHVIGLLETYTKRERQINLLQYEMQHCVCISPEEVIDSMSLGHRERLGDSGNGHISDKTMYIALNYQERMEWMNTETANEIAKSLLELEAEQERIRHYVSLLEKREAEVIRLVYFEGWSQNDSAKKLGIVPRTLRRIKAEAIEKLVEMYIFTERPTKK